LCWQLFAIAAPNHFVMAITSGIGHFVMAITSRNKA
jgi:hypothetical protein